MHAHTHNTNICWKITRKMNFQAGLLNFLWVFLWFSFSVHFFSVYNWYIACSVLYHPCISSTRTYICIMYVHEVIYMSWHKACLMLSRKINITHQTLYGFGLCNIWYNAGVADCIHIIRDVDITSLSGRFLRFLFFTCHNVKKQ